MLTSIQLQTLKSAITAETDAAFVALRAANDEQGMANFYNEPSTKIVWRTTITRKDVTVDGFDFTQVDNLTVGQARIWDWLFEDGPLNPSESGKRAAISEAWKGTAAKVAVATFVLGKCKRTANKAEALYVVGTGTDGSPARLVFEGSLTAQNISDALRS